MLRGGRWNTQRIGWVVVAAVLLAAGAAVGPSTVRWVRYEEIERVGVDPAFSSALSYVRGLAPRWRDEGSALEFAFPYFLCSWPLDGKAASVQGISPGRNAPLTITQYNMDGSVQGQSSLAPIEWVMEPPFPFPVPHTPTEVRQLIHDAKLYAQAAAQRGEVTLPEGWEPVK